MTLTTHTIVGGIVASFFPAHPEIGFVAAFLSHFALDAIPHWDYELKSFELKNTDIMSGDMIIDKRFFKDLINIGLDILIGLIATTYILMFIGKFSFPILIAGTLGGIIPDALQFVYMKFHHEPFISLQKFHTKIQKDKRLKSKPFIGIVSQIAIIVIIVAIFA